MTNMPIGLAEIACSKEREERDQAFQEMRLAEQALDQARQALEDERSEWDESSYATGGSVLGIIGGVLLCVAPDPTLLTKVGCAAGVLGGGAGVAGSEIDRAKEIAAAKAAVSQAEAAYWQAKSRYDSAAAAAQSCVLHHMIQVTPL
jgi:hypothetical protein